MGLLQGLTESLEALRAEEHVERVAVCVVEREEVRQLVHPNVGRVEMSCGCGACFELHCLSEQDVRESFPPPIKY